MGVSIKYDVIIGELRINDAASVNIGSIIDTNFSTNDNSHVPSTASILTRLSAYQSINLANDLTTNDNVHYPSTAAVTTALASKMNVPTLNNGSVVFWNNGLYQDFANLYFAAHLLSVGTNSDYTGTDTINIYNQFDSYQTYSNTVVGTAISPGTSYSTSRGTGPTPSESLDTDPIGGPSWWPFNGTTWLEGAAIRAYVQGNTTGNRGTRLNFVTKANSGSEVVAMDIDNQQRIGIGVAYGSISSRLHVQGIGHGTSATTYAMTIQDSSGNILLQTKDSGVQQILPGISGLSAWTGGLVQILNSQNIASWVNSSTWYSSPHVLIGTGQGSLGIGTDGTIITSTSGSFGPAMRFRHVNGLFIFDNNTVNTGSISTVVITSGTCSSNAEGYGISGGEIRGFSRISASVTGGSHMNIDLWSNTTTNEYRINTSNGSGALLTRFGIQTCGPSVPAYFNNIAGLIIGAAAGTPGAMLDVRGAIQTLKPQGGVSAAGGVHYIGQVINTGGLSFNPSKYLEVSIDGVLYKLALTN